MNKRGMSIVGLLRRPVLTSTFVIAVVAALAAGTGGSSRASPATTRGAVSSGPSAAGVLAGAWKQLPAAAAAKLTAPGPQRRQMAVTTLSRFQVVLTATRVSRLDATVTAVGYRHTSLGWKLIAIRQIGKTGFWSWFATDVCNLKVTQFKPEPSSAVPSDSIRVNLLWGPAIGCLGPYTKHWQP
jgi:hypothetical protein